MALHADGGNPGESFRSLPQARAGRGFRCACGCPRGCPAAAPAAAQALQPEEVAPGVWMVQGASALGTPANRNFISNAAFVVTPRASW